MSCLSAVVAISLMGLASLALAGAPSCSSGICTVPGACFGRLANSEQLSTASRPMYIGKTYTFVYQYEGAQCPDVNNACPEYVASVVPGTSQNFAFVGGSGSLRLSGVRQQDSFVIRPTDYGLIAANWTCSSPCTDASSPLYVYENYALQVPCTTVAGGVGGAVQARSLSLVAPAQTSIAFEQWSDPYTLTIDDDEQLLDTGESVTLQLRIRDAADNDRTGSCEFDPPATSVVIDANTPTVRFAVRCHYAQNTFNASTYSIEATIASANPPSVEGYFYDITPNPPATKPVVASASLVATQQRLLVALRSSGNQAVVGGAPLPTIGGEGEIFVLDTHDRVHTAFVGSATVSLVFPGQTVTPSNLQVSPPNFHQSFTYTVSTPSSAGNVPALAQDIPLSFGISNTDQFSIDNIDGTTQSTFDLDVPSFAAYGATTVTMRIDQVITIPLVLRQPLAASGQVSVLVSNNNDFGALRFSSDPNATPSSFTPTLTVSFAAGAATGQVYYVRVDTASWVSVSSADSETYTIHHELLPSTTSAGAVTAPADIDVTVERMQFYINKEHHSSDGQDLLRGLPLRVAITVAAAPPSTVTITPILAAGGRWDGVTLTPSSISFAPGQPLRQYFTLTASTAFDWTDTMPVIHWIVNGTDANLFAIPADTSLPTSAATADNLWIAQVSDNSVPVRIGEWSDPVWLNFWPVPPTSGVTVQLSTSAEYELSTPSLTFSASQPAAQAYRVRLTQAAIGNGNSYPTGYVVYSLAGADAYLYELSNDRTSLTSSNQYEITISKTIAGSRVGDRSCWTFSHSSNSDGALPGGVSIDVVDWSNTGVVEWDQATPFNFTGNQYRVCATATEPGTFQGRFVLSSGALASWASTSNDYSVWTLNADLQRVLFDSTSADEITPYGSAVQLVLTLGAAAPTSVTLTPRSDADVVFTPSSVTLQVGQYAASFAVAYQPTRTAVETLYVYVDISGTDADLFVTPSAYDLSVELPTVDVLFSSRSDNPEYYYALAAETVPVQLSVPAVNGLTVTVHSSCFTGGSYSVSFGPGESTQALTFTGDNDFDVYNAQRCGISYELSGADQWLFTPPSDLAVTVTTNAEQRFFIGTSEWGTSALSAGTTGSLFEGVDSPLFFASLSTAPNSIVRATLSSPSAVFTPSTLVFSPSSWVAQAFYFTPNRTELGAHVSIYVTFEGNDALNTDYAFTAANVGPFYPRFRVDGVGSLLVNYTSVASGNITVTTPFSLITGSRVGIVPFCGSAGSSAVQVEQSQIVFEPAVWWLTDTESTVPFTYHVRETLRLSGPKNSASADRCQLSYAFLTSQGDWSNSPYIVDPQTSYGNPLVETIIYGTVGTVFIELPGAVGINHPGRRYTLLVSPPSDVELVVRPQSHNLVFDPPQLVIPAGASEASGLVRALIAHKEAFANEAARVQWSFANDAAEARYRFACGSTSCYTFHRSTRNN